MAAHITPPPPNPRNSQLTHALHWDVAIWNRPHGQKVTSLNAMAGRLIISLPGHWARPSTVNKLPVKELSFTDRKPRLQGVKKQKHIKTTPGPKYDCGSSQKVSVLHCPSSICNQNLATGSRFIGQSEISSSCMLITHANHNPPPCA